MILGDEHSYLSKLKDLLTTAGFQSALLISVLFWQKHGFVEVTNQQASESYDEYAKVMMLAL
ncbi:MAG: hypothetical protein KKA29_12445 [Gammaproteobacteria bacterium]|nr:hypothetical protein [Gammaproteobacteria bacterium]